MKKIWLDLTQEELDAAYDQNVYAPNRQQILDRYATNSDITRARLGKPERHTYGAGRNEKLDVYRATIAPGGDDVLPVSIFIHGGAWRTGSASAYGFIAEPFVRAGAHVVVPDFDWVQEHDGNLVPIADQVNRAIAWVSDNAVSLGIDSSRIYLSAHSSGAHLAAVALTSSQLIKGAVLCSGMYDLKPVSLSARSSYVNFNDETIDRLSPVRHLQHINSPLVIAYGSLETPEFQRQSREFAQACKNHGHSIELVYAIGFNHFEIIETLGNPYGVVGAAALRQMSLKGGHR